MSALRKKLTTFSLSLSLPLPLGSSWANLGLIDSLWGNDLPRETSPNPFTMFLHALKPDFWYKKVDARPLWSRWRHAETLGGSGEVSRMKAKELTFAQRPKGRELSSRRQQP